MTEKNSRIIAYELPEKWDLLVGATAAANDYLTTVLADPDDWWFHAEGVPGSHVILRAKPDAEPAKETLHQAASVAAYHSKLRAAGTARVYCTRARFVTKPRNAKPGTVNVSRGKVLKARPGNSFATRVGPEKILPGDTVNEA